MCGSLSSILLSLSTGPERDVGRVQWQLSHDLPRGKCCVRVRTPHARERSLFYVGSRFLTHDPASRNVPYKDLVAGDSLLVRKANTHIESDNSSPELLDVHQSSVCTHIVCTLISVCTSIKCMFMSLSRTHSPGSVWELGSHHHLRLRATVVILGLTPV